MSDMGRIQLGHLAGGALKSPEGCGLCIWCWAKVSVGQWGLQWEGRPGVTWERLWTNRNLWGQSERTFVSLC